MVFATEMIRNKFLNKILKSKDLKKLSIAPIVIGILLFLSVQANAFRLYVIILGILAVIKGIVGIVATEKMHKVTHWWIKASNNVYRVWGIALIIMGSVLLMGIKT